MNEPVDISRKPQGALKVALQRAERGDRIVYWIGEHCGGPHRFDAFTASDDGLCLLFCKRVGKGLFAYTAVKR